MRLDLQIIKFRIVALIFLCSPAAYADVAQEQAEALVNETIDSYSKEIDAVHGLPVEIRFSWQHNMFQALGGRIENVVLFEFFGGLLKGEMDLDAFAVFLCHEVGHALGGYPEVRPYPFPMNSVEGQADYFATSKCLRRIFEKEDNAALIRHTEIPESIRSPCYSVFQDEEQAAICMRSLIGARKAFRIMYEDQSLGFETFDRSIVSSTLMTYPSKQCRLDTLKAGALCVKDARDPFSFTNSRNGACNEDGERAELIGARPKCWFKRQSVH